MAKKKADKTEKLPRSLHVRSCELIRDIHVVDCRDVRYYYYPKAFEEIVVQSVSKSVWVGSAKFVNDDGIIEYRTARRDSPRKAANSLERLLLRQIDPLLDRY